MAFRIITFDSDGVAAVGSALMLYRLDPKGEIVKNTDMFAGNAMGAVTALSLASGLDLGNLIESFKLGAPSYFSEEGDEASFSPVEMGASLSKLFGAARLSELPLSGPKVMVNLDRMEDPQADEWQCHTIGNGRRERFAEMLLSDLAIAACSARGVFDPHILQPMDHPSRGKFRTAECADTNPAADAIAYAEEHFGANREDIEVISIGRLITAKLPKAKVLASEGDRGMRRWAWPFSRFSRSLKSKTGLATVESNSRVSALGDRYTRLNFACDFPVEYSSIDLIDDICSAVDDQCASPKWQEQANTIRNRWKREDVLSLFAKPAANQ